MSETTNVWVKSSALELAITGHAKKEVKRGLPTDGIDDDCIDWGWVYASVQRIVEGESIEVTVKDEESPHHGVTARLPPTALSEGQLLMGNKYGDDDAYHDEHDDDYDDDNSRDYPDDLITLTHLHEPEVVHCLRHRYAADKIYTSTGPILLALNPFKNCKVLYSDKVMKAYWKQGEDRMKGILQEDRDKVLPPHVYGIADHSFRTMMKTLEEQSRGGGGGSGTRRPLQGGGALQKTCDQSILVSGESGAGKTVTTKFIMQYLATLSQRATQSNSSRDLMSKNSSSAGGGSGGQTIEQQVLQSNPILESFGNARTIRNDNSSRFGKFIEIKFSNTGSLVGASIETYLLEKVRLITQAEGERNYHIFYELFCMTDEELDAFGMDGYTVEDFSMTNQSGTYDRRDGVDDMETYEELCKAMETMGISQDERHETMTIPCAALHGSNVRFVEVSSDESALDTSEEANHHLEAFVKLMGITKEALEKAVCYLKIQAGKEFHTRTLSPAKAAKGMEALIKAFYGALFSFLVKRVNDSITVKKSTRSRRPGRGGSSSSSDPTIGVLDIFGFESFKFNSFEQLCINYCNEALQQQFNLFVLKNEQAEYDKEGIEWSFISFPDNQDVLDLIDKKGSGILAVLDDQCRAPGTTDKSFCSALYKKCTGHPRFEADFRQVGGQLFAVKHYAGPVEYHTDGFVQKNRDELPKEATELLLSSTKEIVQQLGAIIRDPPQASSASRSISPARRTGASAKVTVGGQFSRQLHDLRRKIDLTSPHYVRCLKPNDLLVPDHFNPLIISDQLRYAGVIEAVRVSRVGYPHRYSHSAFVARYRVLELAALKKAQKTSRRTKPVVVLTNAISMRVWRVQCEQDGTSDSEEEKKSDEPPNLVSVGIQVGKTKVFLRRRAFEILEQLRRGTMAEAAVQMQKVGRRYVARRDYLSTRRDIVLVQCLVRVQAAKARVHDVRVNYRATRIQTAYRRRQKYHEYVVLKAVAKWLQRTQRGREGRKRYEALNRVRKSIVLQRYWRRYRQQKMYKKMTKSVLALQCAVRCWFARSAFKALKLNARDLSAAVTERDELRKEVQTLRRQLKQSNETLDQVKASAASSASTEELNAASEQIKSLEKELAQSRAAAEEARASCDLEKKRAEDAESALSSAEANGAELRNQLTAIRTESQRATEEAEKAALDQKTKDDELRESNTKLAELQAALDEQKGTNDELKKKVEKLTSELETSKEQLDGRTQEFDGLVGDNDSLKRKLDKAHKKLEIANSDLERSRKETAELRKSSSEVSSNGNTSKELAEAKKTIEKLEKKVKAARSHRSSSSSSDDASSVLSALKKEVQEAKSSSAKEIASLKTKLKNAEQKCAELEAKPSDETFNDAAAEEILTLQDEINRLNRELAEQRGKGGNQEDENSAEALARRYSELRRLAEAGLEKDKEIARLREKFEYLGNESERQPRELTNSSEAEHLRKYIAELQKELEIATSGDSKPRKRSFLAKSGSKNSVEKEAELQEKIFDLEDKVNDKEVEIEALREVNEMLRVDVERSRKRMKELEDSLLEERERSKEELEAFGKTLRGVDELRVAAESMSHQLKRYHEKQPSQNIEFLDEVVEEDAVGDTHLEEATKIIDSARNDLEQKEHLAKDKPPPFWNLDFRPKIGSDEGDKQKHEEDIQRIVAAKAAKRKKRKKKRRGSGSSIVSSFF